MFHLLSDLTEILKKNELSKDEVAAILQMDPEALKAFEESYQINVLTNTSDNLFEINAKQAAEEHEGILMDGSPELDDIIHRIVEELLQKAVVYDYDGVEGKYLSLPHEDVIPVSNEEIVKLPEAIRPQLTGSLMQKDTTGSAYHMLLWLYKKYLDEENPERRKRFYDMFRQGLDIQDLDPITYKIIGTNPNSMGYWLPQIIEAAKGQDFFKIPKTKILTVPLTLLQLTRLEYMTLTRTTLDIVDQFCKKAFHLDEEKEYFIKTGTYSSKFDFRNAHVCGPKEVRELGEYLLFIHFQALCMAHYDLSGRNQPCVYGVSTTNEWVVREFIKDKEGNPFIYKGLPLHTEYRIFVDFDTKKVIGINPYWDPDVMKQRFGHASDADSPHNIHDYVIYAAHEKTLMERYEENKDRVVQNVEALLRDVQGLQGQWSIDIMQNGEDFWLIDMALAQNSALVKCVPKNLLRPTEENWLPNLKA